MENQQLEAIRERVQQQLTRAAYPENMPELPEVPSARYADPAFHDLEMKHLWTKTWLHVGHLSEIPEPGNYKLFEQVGVSIIISRGADNEIRAFHNICRHRGSALLLQPTGTARRFICPYHAWGYAGDGSLVSVPDAHDFACLKKEDRGLMKVRCEVLRGLIYINMDENAEPLATAFASVERQIGKLPLEDMVVKGIITVEMDCNWKAAYDNFLEIYHVRTVHAKSIASFLDSKSFSVSLYKNGHARFVTRKPAGNSVFGKDSPTNERTDDVFMDYTVALPIFPNTFMPIDPIGFTYQGYWPLGPDKSVMVMYMMGWKGDSEEDQQFWKGMRTQIEGIISEDVELFASLQRTFNNGLMPKLLLNWQERAIHWYQEEIDRIIGVENIPEHLRMTPTLAPFAEK